MSIQATNYEVEDMGRYFKSSKKKYKWTFLLDDKSHFLELEFSYLSGKRKLALDGRTLHESMMLTSSFQYPFTLEGFALNVIQQGDSFELRINNKVFSHLFTQCKNQKTQNEFVYEDKVGQKQDAYENNFSQQGFSQVPNSNKFSLNFKMDPTPKEQQAPKTTIQAPKHTNALGQTAVGWEDFEQFGQQVTNNPNPFGNFNSFDDFNKPAQQQQQAPKQQQKIDLLDLDEPVTQTNPIPPKSEQSSQPTQPTNLFDTLLFGQQQPQPTQSQTQNFGFPPAQQQAPQQIPQQNQQFQQQQFQQPQPQFQNPSQPQQQPQNAFEAFGQPQQQQQQQFNIMNLYGPQQVQGNLAYHNFPSLNPQPPQQIPYGNQQATPFDVFK